MDSKQGNRTLSKFLVPIFFMFSTETSHAWKLPSLGEALNQYGDAMGNLYSFGETGRRRDEERLKHALEMEKLKTSHLKQKLDLQIQYLRNQASIDQTYFCDDLEQMKLSLDIRRKLYLSASLFKNLRAKLSLNENALRAGAALSAETKNQIQVLSNDLKFAFENTNGKNILDSGEITLKVIELSKKSEVDSEILYGYLLNNIVEEGEGLKASLNILISVFEALVVEHSKQEDLIRKSIERITSNQRKTLSQLAALDGLNGISSILPFDLIKGSFWETDECYLRFDRSSIGTFDKIGSAQQVIESAIRHRNSTGQPTAMGADRQYQNLLIYQSQISSKNDLIYSRGLEKLMLFGVPKSSEVINFSIYSIYDFQNYMLKKYLSLKNKDLYQLESLIDRFSNDSMYGQKLDGVHPAYTLEDILGIFVNPEAPYLDVVEFIGQRSRMAEDVIAANLIYQGYNKLKIRYSSEQKIVPTFTEYVAGLYVERNRFSADSMRNSYELSLVKAIFDTSYSIKLQENVFSSAVENTAPFSPFPRTQMLVPVPGTPVPR